MTGGKVPKQKLDYSHPAYLAITRGPDGKLLTEAQKNERFKASFREMPEGKIYDFVVKNWKYGLYGAGAYMLLQFTGHVIDVYRWWKGSSDARERASLQRSLDKLTVALGSKDNLLDVAIKVDNRRKIARRKSRSRSRRGF